MRVAVSGGTGYIGSALVRRLAARGDEVMVLTRGGLLPSALELKTVRAVAWSPLVAGPWQRELDAMDAVVHLAGEQAVGKRYTPDVKEGIYSSRVRSLELIVEGVEQAKKKPKVLVSASGVGYYGGRLDAQPLDESAEAGTDFLAEVCIAWEGAARAAEAHGLRVVSSRLGVALGPGGGPLQQMALPFRWFLGGKLGSGKQYFSWIHLDDVVSAFVHALDHESVRGPVNFVAPNAIPQGELAAAIARVLHRPALVPVPAPALKLLFGEGALPLITGQRAVPKVLEREQFHFKYPELEPALRAAFGRGMV